ncbi:hypothetical protein [Bradyrhizobium sp.]|uniref:hypothetical protein n=1 Tax=Bradyrhizobium sp. TaxID=376 RepID=UPI003C73EBD3
MSSTDRPEPAVDDGVEAKSRCVALVPVIPSAQWSHGAGRRWSPNSIFVTQLIATADEAPQTRGMRRATLADAQSAYNSRQSLARGAGSQTRQII